MQYYGFGVIELDDPLLQQFFGSASVKLRGQALGDIGWSLIQEGASLSDEMQERFMRLWESRMSVLIVFPLSVEHSVGSSLAISTPYQTLTTSSRCPLLGDSSRLPQT
jgi:hypothetical protein